MHNSVLLFHNLGGNLNRIVVSIYFFSKYYEVRNQEIKKLPV